MEKVIQDGKTVYKLDKGIELERILVLDFQKGGDVAAAIKMMMAAMTEQSAFQIKFQREVWERAKELIEPEDREKPLIFNSKENIISVQEEPNKNDAPK